MNLSRSHSAVFLGSKPFGLAIFKSLVSAEPSVEWTIIHPDDRSDARSNFEAFKVYCRQNIINLKFVKNRGEAETALASLSYDIAFVCGWYWLLADKFVGPNAPPIYGIHNSLLPRYRGGAPLVWSILNGEREVGGSLFRLSPRMDDGDIAMQVKVNVDQNATVGALLSEIEHRFVHDIPSVWKDIVSGQANMTRQDHSLATFCSQRRPEDGLINWSDTAQNIHNFIRAQSSPYPCAFTFCERKKIYIDRAEVFPAPYSGRPGQVVERNSSHVVVATGMGSALRILEAHDTSGKTDLYAIFRSGARLLGRQLKRC